MSLVDRLTFFVPACNKARIRLDVKARIRLDVKNRLGLEGPRLREHKTLHSGVAT